MDLEPFGWSVGISDILGWRECPARFALGMRRHIELPPHLQLEPGERDEPPESTNWTNAYGSAIHMAIHLVDVDGLSHQRAIETVVARYGPWLEPAHIELLAEDLKVFEKRRPLGVTLVAAEQDVKVPLFVADNGQQIYFRFKLDVLHKLISNPSIFLHRDYKSTAWPKSQKEIHDDPQLWSYNFGIHERYPECKRLLQTWDGLRFGEIRTSKNDAQRAQIRTWLIEQVKAIMADDVYKPKINDWCRYCPMVVTCRETKRATSYWRGRLAVTAPMSKEGRAVRVALAEDGDEIDRIIRDELPKMQQVRKHIELVESTLKDIIKQMPLEDRERLGWALQPKTRKTLAPEGLKVVHALLGDVFYELVSLPTKSIDEYFGKPKKGQPLSEELTSVRQYLLSADQDPSVVPAKSAKKAA